MMARSVPEWVGATDDTAIPQRVRLRVWERCEGRCGECGRKIGPSDSWIIEHLLAIINGGQNRENNLGVTCGWCKPDKDRKDVAVKVKSARVRAKHAGVKKTSGRPMPGTKASGLKKAFDGRVIKR
jgi:5-methylcytosine-specific restriction endonuclease McrA